MRMAIAILITFYRGTAHYGTRPPNGYYHGHAAMLLVQVGSGVVILGLSDSPGVLADTARDTLVADFNNLDSVEKIYKKYSDQIAAIILAIASKVGK
jgi:glutamate-1-semialdehyde aminotransferase